MRIPQVAISRLLGIVHADHVDEEGKGFGTSWRGALGTMRTWTQSVHGSP
jgi:hypothetical protein